MTEKVLKKKKSIFTFPIDSADLKMWELDTKPCLKTEQFVFIKLEQKMVKLQQTEGSKNKTFVVPFLH